VLQARTEGCKTAPSERRRRKPVHKLGPTGTHPSPVARRSDEIFVDPQAQYHEDGLRLLTTILEVLSSNLDSDTGNPD
jgi:hypothetical protein